MSNMQIVSFFPVFFAVFCFVACEDSCEVNRVENGDVLREDIILIRNSSGHQIGIKSIYFQAITSSSAGSGSSLYIRCNDPYRFQGDRTRSFVEISCRNGKWEPFPVCILPPCDIRLLFYLGLDKGGERIFFHGESFEPKCLHGYKVAETADKRIICENGQWTGNLPPCTKEVQCKLPQKPVFGSMELFGNSAAIGSVVIFRCETGRKLVGSSVSKCNNISEWTSPPPICVAGCKTESLLEFEGLIIENRRPLDDGEWFEARCDEGFKLTDENNPKIYCRDGGWQGTLPPCISSEKSPCNTETLLDYEGLIVENRRTVKDGDSFQPKCDEGYEILDKDDPMISCRDGKWEGNIPPCNPAPCSTYFLSVFDGLIMDDDFQFNDGQSLSVKCAPGYEVSSKNDSDILCRKGQWVGNLPPCVSISEDCQLPSVSNGDLGRYEEFKYRLRSRTAFKPVNEGETLNEEESLTLRCNNDYVPIGKKEKEITIYCIDGKLSPAPKCVKASKLQSCSAEFLLGFSGVVLSSSRTVTDGDWIEPKCAEGYEYLNKNATKLYCRDGRWEGTMPPCFPAPCLDNPPIPENGRIQPNWFNVEHGSIVKYECIRNFEMIEEGSMRCFFGKWTGSLPTCKDNTDQCEVPLVENGEILKIITIAIKNTRGITIGEEPAYVEVDVGSSKSSGSTLHLRCRSPYKFPGEKGDGEINDITCQGGRWIPSPLCERRTSTCSMASLLRLLPSDIIIYADDTSNSVVPEGSVLKLACRQSRMVFRGRSNAICSENGTWSVGSNIQCFHGCASVQVDSDSDLIVLPDKRFYNFGESITFSCPVGMILTEDVERILCLSYGWEPSTIPDCN